MRIVGDAGTVAEAVALVERVRPQVVLLDMNLPDASGPEACRRVLAACPQTHVLVLTGIAEDALVVAAVQSGARGYVLKDVRPEELIQAIRTVAGGRSFLDPSIAQRAFHWIGTQSRSAASAPAVRPLSPQERLIMPLLVEGRTNKEIAASLKLSDKTIKNYLANIFDKLHVKRRTEAVAWFLKEKRSLSAGQP
jgi:DNA-binding NarL/FixJ family response regulator